MVYKDTRKSTAVSAELLCFVGSNNKGVGKAGASAPKAVAMTVPVLPMVAVDGQCTNLVRALQLPCKVPVAMEALKAVEQRWEK